MSDEFRVPTGDGDSLVHHITAAGRDDWKALTRGLERRVHGVFVSRKMETAIPWRNRGERDLMVLLETDANVLSWEHLPERVNLSFGGEKRVHYPSFRVHTTRGRVILDVFRTPSGQPGSAHPLAGMTARAYAAHGRGYRALSEAEIRIQPRFGNALHVLGFRSFVSNPASEQRVIEALSRRRGAATVRAISADLADEADPAGVVFAMAIRGVLRLDMSAEDPLGMTATLRAGALS